MQELTLTRRPLGSYKDTVKEIFRLASTYFRDLENFKGENLSGLSPKEFFNFVKNLTYVRDPNKLEFVTRPGISLELAGTGHPFDCDDKTALSLAYFYLKNANYRKDKGLPENFNLFNTRVRVVGRGEKPHHVFCEFKNNGEKDFIPFDCTYPQNEFGKVTFLPGFEKIFYRPIEK